MAWEPGESLPSCCVRCFAKWGRSPQDVRLYGPDTGYAKIPCPGHWNEKISAGWFVRQARLRGVPHIPIINSNNAGLTFLDGIHTAAAASTKVSLNVVELRNKFVG